MNEASKKTEKADDATNEDSKDEPEYILCKSCHEKEQYPKEDAVEEEGH